MKDKIQTIKIPNYTIELQEDAKSSRSIREAILKIAYSLLQNPDEKGVLVAVSGRMTEVRIEKEWQLAQSTLKPQIAKRMFLVKADKDRSVQFPPEIEQKTRNAISRALSKSPGVTGMPGIRKSARFDILRALILQWLNGRGPTTLVRLSQDTGYSYPTIAITLRRLGHHLKRYSDRRIELASFPREEWLKLVAMSDFLRSSFRFVDKSGMPKPFDSLIKKLSTMGRSDVAIGGVFGARHYYPGLDLVGSPRLDITVISNSTFPSLDFVQKLDPVLEISTDLDRTPHVVIHVQTGEHPQFESGLGGALFADPVACLLDLYEARLHAQAEEFLRELIRRRGKE